MASVDPCAHRGTLPCQTDAAPSRGIGVEPHEPVEGVQPLRAVGDPRLGDDAELDLLYIGVALLGLRIDLADLVSAGWLSAAIVIGGLGVTILFGVWFAQLLREDRKFGILMGGAVAICGASAAAAICAAMPKCDARDRQLTITIAGITGLSTLAKAQAAHLVDKGTYADSVDALQAHLPGARFLGSKDLDLCDGAAVQAAIAAWKRMSRT